MPKVQFSNSKRLIEIRNGETILQAAKKGRVPLNYKCGGKGSCTTCKVIVEDQSSVSTINSIESRFLSEDNRELGYRLGCQTKVYGNVEVKMIEDPLKSLIQRQLEQLRREKENNS